MAGSKSGEVKAILWDVMGTLVSEPFRDVFPDFFRMSFAELIELKNEAVWVAFEKGQASEDTYLREFFLDGRSFDRGLFRMRLRAAYEWLPGMQRLLSDLHERGCPMHALSNYPEWYRWIEERLQLSRYLRWDFVSCRTGLRKPDPEAYLHAARSLGLAPGDCLFIDDRAINTDAARSVGMDSLRFRGSATLREQLAERALL